MRAFITLLLNPEYLPGTLALCQSIRDTGSTTPIVLLYSKSGLTKGVLGVLTESGFFSRLINVDNDLIVSRNEYELKELLKRAELDKTLTKLNCWRLIEYEKLIYLDSDMVLVDQIDNLFDTEVSQWDIAASPDCGWPDCFNSGLFVLKPSFETFRALKSFAESVDSFDGSDQGLLNEFFSLTGPSEASWIRLPFGYNCTLSSNYEYVPALVRFQKDLKVIHFIGAGKPWTNRILSYSSKFYKLYLHGSTQNFFELWWSFYDEVTVGELSSIDLLQISGHLQPRPGLKVPIAAPEEEEKFEFPSFYYKPTTEASIEDESSKGEAYKMKEAKVTWPQGQPITYAQPEDPTAAYVRENPVFPWESGNVVTTRVFDNSPVYEPPSYEIRMRHGKTTVKPVTSAVHGKALLGFESGNELSNYLKEVQNIEDSALDQNADDLQIEKDIDNSLDTTTPRSTIDATGPIVGSSSENVENSASAAKVEEDIEEDDGENTLLARDDPESEVDKLVTQVADKL